MRPRPSIETNNRNSFECCEFGGYYFTERTEKEVWQFGHATTNYEEIHKPEPGWSTIPPSYYNVKKARVDLLANYKYQVYYKANKECGRVLRYFVCLHDNCGRKFNKTWNLIDHMRIHTGERPYKCEICAKEFTQKGNFNKHVSLHYEIR